jgi:hypothetical protein
VWGLPAEWEVRFIPNGLKHTGEGGESVCVCTIHESRRGSALGVDLPGEFELWGGGAVSDSSVRF